jgi:hypothetical protein
MPVGTILSALSLLIVIITAIVGRAVYVKLTGNDLKHLTDNVAKLEKDTKEDKDKIWSKLENLKTKMESSNERLAAIQALCEERHKR